MTQNNEHGSQTRPPVTDPTPGRPTRYSPAQSRTCLVSIGIAQGVNGYRSRTAADGCGLANEMNMGPAQHSDSNFKSPPSIFQIATKPKLNSTQLPENKRRRASQISTECGFSEEKVEARRGPSSRPSRDEAPIYSGCEPRPCWRGSQDFYLQHEFTVVLSHLIENKGRVPFLPATKSNCLKREQTVALRGPLQPLSLSLEPPACPATP